MPVLQRAYLGGTEVQAQRVRISLLGSVACCVIFALSLLNYLRLITSFEQMLVTHFPAGHSRTGVSTSRGGTRHTPRSRVSASREGRGCTPRSCFSSCRGGKGCKGCTPRSFFHLAVRAGVALRAVGFPLAVGAGVALRAVVFHLAVGARGALRAQAFPLAVGAGVAHRAVRFPLAVRAGVAVRAVAFHLAVRTRVALRAVAFYLAVRAPLFVHGARQTPLFRRLRATSHVTASALHTFGKGPNFWYRELASRAGDDAASASGMAPARSESDQMILTMEGQKSLTKSG